MTVTVSEGLSLNSKYISGALAREARAAEHHR